MLKRTLHLSFFIVVVSLFFYFTQPLLAQTNEKPASLGLSVSPVTLEFSAEPGTLLESNLRIYNPTDQKIDAYITVEDFVPVGEEGFVEIVEPDLKRITSLANWIKIEKEKFSIEPREQKTINFSIEVPKDAEPGGKYSSLIVNIGGAPGESDFGGAALKQKIASLILLSVAGATEEKLLIKEFQGPDFQEYGPITFSLYLENQGTVHLRPRGLIAITDWRNHKVADLIIPQRAIIPGARRIINVQWPEKNLIGRFTATVVGSYGSLNQPFTATWTFWVWPWKVSLLILIIIIALLILLIRGRKRIGAALKILFKGEGLENQVEKEKKSE